MNKQTILIKFKGNEVECSEGEILKKVLQNKGFNLHNGQSKWLNCKGLGTCGTCAVHVVGNVSAPNSREKWRLNFKPFSNGLEQGFRLACQTKVKGNCEVKKGKGFWGEKL